jgi:hypothetical protein
VNDDSEFKALLAAVASLLQLFKRFPSQALLYLDELIGSGTIYAWIKLYKLPHALRKQP